MTTDPLLFAAFSVTIQKVSWLEINSHSLYIHNPTIFCTAGGPPAVNLEVRMLNYAI